MGPLVTPNQKYLYEGSARRLDLLLNWTEVFICVCFYRPYLACILQLSTGHIYPVSYSFLPAIFILYLTAFSTLVYIDFSLFYINRDAGTM